MWLSKKKYNELVNRIEKLEECHTSFLRLNPKRNPFDDNSKEEQYIKYYTHKKLDETTACVENIGNIILQELASYVIDHKPIERKEKFEVTKKYF